MSDAVDDVERAPGSLTRRNALRAGLAVGVGVAAWSGASITSLGGTPAYAAQSTIPIPPIDLTADGGCRNVDSGSGDLCAIYRYHDAAKFGIIHVDGFVDGSFTVVPPLVAGVCCGTPTTQTLTHPSTVSCTVTIRLFDGQQDCPNGADKGSFTNPNTTATTTVITYPCIGAAPFSSDKFTLFAHCVGV